MDANVQDLLDQLRAFLASQAAVVDSPDGPQSNRARQLLDMLDQLEYKLSRDDASKASELLTAALDRNDELRVELAMWKRQAQEAKQRLRHRRASDPQLS